jgi:hypothetical protein
MSTLLIESSKLYKLAIYFGIATLYFYRKDVIPLNEGENLGKFAENNKDVLKRVFDETLEVMQYELSDEQMYRIISAYTRQALSVRDTEVGGKPLSVQSQTPLDLSRWIG